MRGSTFGRARGAALLLSLLTVLAPAVARADDEPSEPPAHLLASLVGVATLTVSAVIVAFLINRFQKKKRKHIRRVVIPVLLADVTFGIAKALVAAREPNWANGFFFAAEVLAEVTVINLASIAIFDLALPAFGAQPAALIGDLAMGVGYLVVLVTAMRRGGVEPSSIAAAGGALTALLAFSFQQTLGNILGGVALQLDSSIRVGDWIQLENGRQGKVAQIRWRHTVIETRDWDTIIVPNAALLSANIIILGKREGEPIQHRMWVYFNVDFRHRPAEVIRVVEEALRASTIEGVAHNPPPNCICLDLAREHKDSFAYFAVRYWLTDLARDDPVSSTVRERVHSALKRAGIPLAVPGAQIWVEKDNAERRDEKVERDLERRRAALATVELFRTLHEDELVAIARSLRPAPFTRGEVITRQGAVAHWLYIVTSGSVEVRVQVDGKETPVATIKAPGFFGEMGLMTGEPRAATVVAVDEVECFRLDHEQFTRILGERPALATEISNLLAERRVELLAVREKLDAAAKQQRLVVEQGQLYAKIRAFFALDTDRPRKS